MKIIFFLLIFSLASCVNSIEKCSTKSFDGFETDSLNIEQYHFLNDDLINDLRPAIDVLLTSPLFLRYSKLEFRDLFVAS